MKKEISTLCFQPSVLDRLGSSTGGKHIISLREESSASVRSDSSLSGYNQGVARAVSSAITSAHRSVCVLPPSNSSGKKLEVSNKWNKCHYFYYLVQNKKKIKNQNNFQKNNAKYGSKVATQ